MTFTGTPYLRGDEAQFGGEKHTSTGHYLLELIEFILEAWETTNETVIAICLDFSKGYNRILHSRLVTILSDMGVPAYLLTLSVPALFLTMCPVRPEIHLCFLQNFVL